MIRAALKGIAEAVGAGVAPLARAAGRGDIAVLSYHNVVPDPDAGRGDSSLHVPWSRFARHLDRLCATHTVVPLDATGDPGSRPRAVITFDDAYLGAVELALPELARRGLPATVFVAPGLLGQGTFWWDDLAEAGVLDERTRDHALESLDGQAAAVRAALLPGREGPPLPASYRVATEDELHAALSPGLTLGSHGWSHAHLPTLSREGRREELYRSLAWIREAGGVDWLALPYGRGSAQVADEALAAGYRGVLEIDGGIWRDRRNVAAIPRINVPAGLSARGLDLRISGLR